MKVKKFLSYLLAVGTIAFSGPMAFADWELIDVRLRPMVDFTKLKNSRENWCWLSTSLELLEYWTKKSGRTGDINRALLKECDKMTGLTARDNRIRRENFEVYRPLFNKINEVLNDAKSVCNAFDDRSPLNVESDDLCNTIINAKAIENFLNSIYSSEKPFYSFCRNYEQGFSLRKDGHEGINLEVRHSAETFYNFIEKIITKNKCPIIVGLAEEKDKKGSFYTVEKLNSMKSDPECALGVHAFLITGIDVANKKIQLKDPNPTDSSAPISIGAEKFNECATVVFGVLDKSI